VPPCELARLETVRALAPSLNLDAPPDPEVGFGGVGYVGGCAHVCHMHGIGIQHYMRQFYSAIWRYTAIYIAMYQLLYMPGLYLAL